MTTTIPPEQAAEPEPNGTSDIDAMFWKSRPELEVIRTFAQSRMTSPWACLGVVLARVVAATPPWAVLPAIIGGHGSLNLFVGLVGPSGDGKGAATSAARDAVLMTRPVTVVPVGSGEGLSHVYKRREKKDLVWNTDSALVSIPEIDTLTSLATRSSSTVLPELRKAWSGEDLGFSYADPSRRLLVEAHSYRLSLVCGIQPERAEALLGDSDGGTPQRFLWMPVTDPAAPDHEPDEPEPYRWNWSREMERFSSGAMNLVMQVHPGAVQEIREARRARNRGEGDPLDGHRLYGQLKAAAAMAVLAGRADVSAEDWELASMIMQVSTRTRTQVQNTLAAEKRTALQKRAVAEATSRDYAEDFVENRALERVTYWITQWLARKPCRESDMKQSLNSRDRRYFKDALDRLQAEKRIKLQGRGGADERWALVQE